MNPVDVVIAIADNFGTDTASVTFSIGEYDVTVTAERKDD